MRLHSKFLFFVLGTLAIFLGALSYVMVEREAGLLQRKAEEKQHLLAFTIYSDLKRNMMTGTPRSTLKLMSSLRGTYGLVRLEALKKDGTPAFGIRGGRFDIPQLEKAFETGAEIFLRENGPPPLHTVIFPLKNEPDCMICHINQSQILGVLLISLSREDTVKEIERSTEKLALSLFTLILLIGAVLYFLIRKVVLQPLAILHEGAERIGRGEFAHRIGLSTKDEIQELAQSFNVMAGRLEDQYDVLENSISERTGQVVEAMAEAEDKARQLYKYSRDMATISRLSIKVFNVEQTRDDLLDRFMHAVGRGLGYNRALLCLIDRKRAWLEISRDTGLGAVLRLGSGPLSGPDAFVKLARTGKSVSIEDISKDPVFSRYRRHGNVESCALHLIPILKGAGKPCWQAKNCTRTNCAAYEAENEACWLVEHTLCGNTCVESYGDKLALCMSCNVFPVLGILVVAVEQLPPRNRDVKVLRILAAEMGAALENHRLHYDNRQLVQEFLEFHRVTATVLTDPSLDRALEAFTDSALKFSGLDACNFWLLSEDENQLVHRSGGCLGPDPQKNFCPERLPLDKGVLGRALRENAIITEYHTVFNDPTPLGAATAAADLPSLLALPLRTEKRSIGVFSIHKKSRTPFLETEVAVFMLLTNHAAMAINVCLLNEELKNQNRELEKSTNLMGGILLSMSSGVMLLDMKGSVQLINEAGAQLLHSRPLDVMNKRLEDFLPEAGVFVKSSIGPYHEAEIKRQDGTKIPVGFSSAYYNGATGMVEGTIIVYRDLTEIKELQAKVLHKERFAAVGQVVAGVAHEIRNPLFGISSIGQIFERELKDQGHLELVRALLSETKRLNHLVEDLLMYTRPIKLSLKKCDLVELWEEVIGMHREELAQRGITFKGDLNIGHTPSFVDANQIRQVFLNLIRNAVDATASGGNISVRLLLEDRYIIFKLTDTGEGILAENIDKVFNLFFTTKPKGSGLGLAICRKIVEDHGGSIQVESRERVWRNEPPGTTVTVKLPYRVINDKH